MYTVQSCETRILRFIFIGYSFLFNSNWLFVKFPQRLCDRWISEWIIWTKLSQAHLFFGIRPSKWYRTFTVNMECLLRFNPGSFQVIRNNHTENAGWCREREARAHVLGALRKSYEFISSYLSLFPFYWKMNAHAMIRYGFWK